MDRSLLPKRNTEVSRGTGEQNYGDGELTFAQRLQARRQQWQRELEQELKSTSPASNTNPETPLPQYHAEQQQQHHHQPLQQGQRNDPAINVPVGNRLTSPQGQLESSAQGHVESTACTGPEGITEAMHPLASPRSPCKRPPANLYSPPKRLPLESVAVSSSEHVSGSARMRLFGGSQEVSSREAHSPPRVQHDAQPPIGAPVARGSQVAKQGNKAEVIVISDSD